MSDESISMAGRTDAVTDFDSDGEFSLSTDDAQLIKNIQSQINEYTTPTDPHREETVDLTKIDAVQTRKLDTQPRVIIDVNKSGMYTLQLFEGNGSPYERNHISHVFLNGKQIDVRDGGLELFNTPVTIYRTYDDEFIASIWT